MMNDRLMTYEQWRELFKRQLKKFIRRKLSRLLYGLTLFLILVLPPLAMIIHWILTGY